MILPAWREWVFALKVCAAALLALFVALWIDLARPYWAVSTVFITIQPLAGATRSKAIYRVYGTLLGAIVSVILVPNLVNAPEVLTVALALWIGLCLYFSLLDRTPRSYVLMLAGYTAALVGLSCGRRSRHNLRHRGGARRGDHARHPVREPGRIHRAAAIGRAGDQDPP
jgi:uncharacterized membrane protein YccC